jgi:hypothetical protein
MLTGLGLEKAPIPKPCSFRLRGDCSCRIAATANSARNSISPMPTAPGAVQGTGRLGPHATRSSSPLRQRLRGREIRVAFVARITPARRPRADRDLSRLPTKPAKAIWSATRGRSSPSRFWMLCRIVRRAVTPCRIRSRWSWRAAVTPTRRGFRQPTPKPVLRTGPRLLPSLRRLHDKRQSAGSGPRIKERCTHQPCA